MTEWALLMSIHGGSATIFSSESSSLMGRSEPSQRSLEGLRSSSYAGCVRFRGLLGVPFGALC